MKRAAEGATVEVRDKLLDEYCAATPNSRAAFERARQSMPGGAKGAYFYAPYPITMARGEGCILYDVDGRRYVDFVNHHTAQILGHAHPRVTAAVQHQLAQGIVLGAPTGVESVLAEEICSRVHSVERIRFCNSGTEATLHAVRLARGHSQRPMIAKFEGGYHGSHDAVEISVAPTLEAAGPADAPHAVPAVRGISAHAAEETLVLPYHNEAAVERLLTEHRHELACVMLDPKAGIMPLRPDFVHFVRDITHDYGVLLIFDEIVGFRLARGGMQGLFGIKPDLSTYGKLIGGGFPVGAFGGRADLMDLLDATQGATGFFQSGTFSAHPVAMAAGLATLHELTPDAFDQLDQLGERLRNGLNELFSHKDVAAQAVGTGSLFSIYFTDRAIVDYRSMATNDRVMANRLFLALLMEGYALNPGLIMNSISLPMEIDQVDGLIAATATALDRVAM
jgi:glutamate-1-semialdehyde 2,1-aminomutase